MCFSSQTWLVQARESVSCVRGLKLCVPTVHIREVVAGAMVKPVRVVSPAVKVRLEGGHHQVVSAHFEVALGVVDVDKSPLEVDSDLIVGDPPGQPIKQSQSGYGELVRVKSDPRLVSLSSQEHCGPTLKSGGRMHIEDFGSQTCEPISDQGRAGSHLSSAQGSGQSSKSR